MQQMFAGNLHINTCPTYKPAHWAIQPMQQTKDTEKLKHNTTNKEIINSASSRRYTLVCILANNWCISANLTEVKIHTSAGPGYVWM
jgi:membrane glycosyltransferase